LDTIPRGLRRALAWVWGDPRRGLGLAAGLRLSVAVHVILLLLLAWMPARSRPASWESRPLVVSLVGRPGGGSNSGPASLGAPVRGAPAAAQTKPKLPEFKRKEETPPAKPQAKPKEEPKEKPKAPPLPEAAKTKTDASLARVPDSGTPDDRVPSAPNDTAARGNAATPAGGAAGGTGTGGAGTGAGGPLQLSAGIDEPGFGYDYYLQALIGKISETWRPPAGMPSDALGASATLRFRLTAEGRVQQVDVETQSAFALFDRSALEAITRAQPFPPFPPGYAGRGLTVHLKFTFRE
jgi:protein TonB